MPADHHVGGHRGAGAVEVLHEADAAARRLRAEVRRIEADALAAIIRVSEQLVQEHPLAAADFDDAAVPHAAVGDEAFDQCVEVGVERGRTILTVLVCRAVVHERGIERGVEDEPARTGKRACRACRAASPGPRRPWGRACSGERAPTARNRNRSALAACRTPGRVSRGTPDPPPVRRLRAARLRARSAAASQVRRAAGSRRRPASGGSFGGVGPRPEPHRSGRPAARRHGFDHRPHRDRLRPMPMLTGPVTSLAQSVTAEHRRRRRRAGSRVRACRPNTQPTSPASSAGRPTAPAAPVLPRAVEEEQPRPGRVQPAPRSHHSRSSFLHCPYSVAGRVGVSTSGTRRPRPVVLGTRPGDRPPLAAVLAKRRSRCSTRRPSRGSPARSSTRPASRSTPGAAGASAAPSASNRDRARRRTGRKGGSACRAGPLAERADYIRAPRVNLELACPQSTHGTPRNPVAPVMSRRFMPRSPGRKDHAER